MAKHIMFCKKCKKFTIKDACACGSKTLTTKPAKYSPEDKWGKYRRRSKKEKTCGIPV